MANTKDNISKYAISFIGFDEESGSTYDEIGKYTGTLTRAPIRVTGWNGEGYAIQFNGTNQFIKFDGNIISSGDKSIRLKFKTSDTGNQIMLSVGRDVNNLNGIGLGLVDGTFRFLVYNNSASPTNDVLSIRNDLNDGQWHDLFITVENANLKIFIDGELDSENVINEPIDYTPNLGLFIGKTNVSGYENFFNGELDSIEVYDRIVSPIADKYLILHNNEYKYHDGTAWQVTTATEENFIQFGMEQLSQITEAQWQELTGDISIVMWSDFEDKQYMNVVLERDPFTAKDVIGDEYNIIVMKEEDIEQQQLLLDAIGLSQTVYPLSDASLLGVKEILSIELNATGNGRIAISVDSGTTWNAFDGSNWLTISDISQGMTFTDFNNLTVEQIEVLLGDSKFIRFAYYLTGDTTINEIVIKVSTEGIPEFAHKDDYDLSYDIDTKTITYIIKKSGEYIINYTDAE